MVDETFYTDSVEPTVQIFTTKPVPEKEIGHILWGLEEEGIPAKVQEVRNDPLVIIAKQAADSSHLNVGIGVDGNGREVILHHRDLPSEKPLFSLSTEEFQSTQLRRLGANAARLVKGDPLIFQDNTMYHVDPEREAQLQQDQSENLIQLHPDQLEKLISMVVIDILNNIK
jgi:hypothetical protein